MTLLRIAPVLIVALLSLSSCGSGCGRENEGKADGEPRPTTTAPTPPTTSSTAAPVASDAEKHRLSRPRRWNVGDVATVGATTLTTGRVTQIESDGSSNRLPTIREKVRATWVEKVVEVDGDGRRSRYLVDLRGWLRTQGGFREDGVEGTVVAVSGVGAARRWSFVGREPELSAEARNWMDAHFGAHGLSDDQWLRIMLPAEEVAVGESWSPDAVLLRNEMTGTGLTIDGAAAAVTLEAIEGDGARCLFTGALALLRFPNTEVPWSKGGSMAFEGDMSVTLDPAPLSMSTLRLKATLEGETTQNGGTVRYDFVSDERRTTVPGGDFTEPAR